jgi:hypothetical protein
MDAGRRMRVSESLQSWKEIACYMKRGVRTVQRWEHEAALPVRRHGAGRRSAVFAFPSEIDQWMLSRPIGKPQLATDQQKSFDAPSFSAAA